MRAGWPRAPAVRCGSQQGVTLFVIALPDRVTRQTLRGSGITALVQASHGCLVIGTAALICVCAVQEVRDAFRRFMAKSELECWDWAAAGIPSALSEELEAAQAAKKVRGGG